MNGDAAEKIADAVLYEGYMLYPYRPSAIKNRQRWMFGTLYPPAYEEVARGTVPSRMHSECLLLSDAGTTVHIRLRFLQLRSRQLHDSRGNPVSSLLIDGQLFEGWDEGVPQAFEFDLPGLGDAPCRAEFRFPAEIQTETLKTQDSQPAATVIRTQQQINGTLTCSAEKVGQNVFKLTLDVTNETALTADPSDRNKALLQSLLSAHMILAVRGGEFVSLLEPPESLGQLTTTCKNVGNFPVLLGEPGSHDMILCSPILLYDYPRVAPESAGDFFDGTEMDEMLTLRVMTLTDQEKNEMRSADDRVRSLLQRTEETAREQLMRTHGTIRDLRPSGEK